jgi:hypothetical protein
MVKTSARAPRHRSAVLPAMPPLSDRVLAEQELGMRDRLTRDFAASVQRGVAELWSLLLVLEAVAAEIRGAFQDDAVIPSRSRVCSRRRAGRSRCSARPRRRSWARLCSVSSTARGSTS